MTTPSRSQAALLITMAAGCAAEPPPAANAAPSAPASAAPVGASAPSPDARTTVLGPEASAFDFERMTRYPEPGFQVPRSASLSPDGKLAVYRASEAHDEQMALFGYDLATGKTRVLVRASDLAGEVALSREEELRRERQRQHTQGITDYRFARHANVMVLPFGGDLYLRDAEGAIARLTSTKEPEIDPALSDDGTKVAYVRGRELYVMDLATRKETALTKGAREGVTRGQSDFVAQEELDEPSGFFWSPRGDKIVYLEVDDSAVGTVPVLGYRGGKADLMSQKYPLAGGKNPAVRAGIVDLSTKKTTWLSWPTDEERYLTRFRWSEGGSALLLETLSRDQKHLSLVRADASTGRAAPLFTQSSPAWMELAEMHPLEQTARVLWTSPRGGHNHLELRDATTGAVLAALTQGDGDVLAIVGADEAKGEAYVLATFDGPLEKHLYAVALDGKGAPRRLTAERGTHEVSGARPSLGFIDMHSAVDRAPKAVIRRPDGTVLGELPSSPDPDMDALRIRPVELVSLRGPSGDTLYGALLKPRVMEPGKRYPVLVSVYGGPGRQAVADVWQPKPLWQHLADRGFVVFQLDNRGTAGRGPAFAEPIAGKLGEVELEDQLAGVAWLKGQTFVDGERMAIYGHSYGGFLAGLAMLKAPGVFKVGIAGSPVTDFRLYDTAYTERYLGLPDANPAGYDGTNLAPLAKNLAGKLLVMHALMDENVHFENTANLINAFVAAQKPVDVFVFPGERHGYRDKAAHAYALRRVVDYLVSNL